MRPYTAASARTKAAASPASEDHDLLLECCVCRESTAIAAGLTAIGVLSVPLVARQLVVWPVHHTVMR